VAIAGWSSLGTALAVWTSCAGSVDQVVGLVISSVSIAGMPAIRGPRPGLHVS
jgi:hypothetical protein